MDCRKNWNAYGWTGGFTFAKVMSFTCGWRGAPVKNGRSLCGAWSSAQSLLSCWTNAVHQTQPSQSLTPPAPPVSVPADARQHLALAVLALFFKHNDFKPAHGGFSLATWLGIAATAALSTPIALADCYSPEGPGAHPPAAVLKAWNDLHTADCSSAVLLTLSCAQHCARTSKLSTSYEAPMPSVHITEDPPSTGAQHTTTHIPAASHTAHQLAQASSLLPPPEPESFELSNPIWSCHPSHTQTAPKQHDAHQLSLTATEPLRVHVVSLLNSSAPTSSNHSSSAGQHKRSVSTSHASDHVDWPVLPSAACANECQECEPWCALSAAAGQLWKHVEPSVADYCKHAITEYHKCRGDCYHPQQQHQQHQSSSSMPPVHGTDEPYASEYHADGSVASTMHLLDNITSARDHNTRCRLQNSELSVGSTHHTNVTTHLGNHSCHGTAGSTRLSSHVIASAKSTPLEVIHEEPTAESATELTRPEPTWPCAMESELDSFPAADAVSNSTHQPGSTEVAACAETVAASSSQEFDVCQLGLSTPSCTEEIITEHFGSQIAESSESAACGEQLSGSGRCEESATHTVLMGSLVRAALQPPQAVDMQLDAMQVNGQGVAAHIEPISIDSSSRSRRCSSSSSDGDVLHRAEKRAKLCQSVETDCAAVDGRKSDKRTEAFSQYLAWREQLLGTQGLELTLAVLGVPDLSLTARADILNAESTLRLDEMPRVLQALEWDMHELQSQASIISEGLDYFRAHPTAGSWEMAEGHLETLDEYFQKARTIVGRMPPCTEASRTQVLQLVVPPLVQCSKVCSAGLATLLSKQAQSATNIRGSDMTEQLELVQRFVHLAVQITQEFREGEIVVPDLDYSQELGHAVRDVNVAFTTSAKRLQTSAIGGLFQAHTARNTAELDRVLAMTKMWKQAHKLSGAIGKVWPDLQGTTLSQLAECQKHAAEAFAKLLRSPQHAQQGQRGKKAANAATPQSPPPAVVDEAAWSDKSVSSEEIARLKRVLDLLSSVLHYSKTTYKEVMQRKPQDKADGRRYAAIQQAFFDVALSLAKRSSRWTGPRVRTLQGGVLGDLKRCQSEVLRFIVEWDKSCVGVPGHKQMVNLQEITCRLVRQYMALQRQSSRDSLSTPRTRQPELDARDMHPYTRLPATHPPGTQSPSLPSTTNTSPFANPTAQSAKTTAAFTTQAINDMSTSHFHLPGMLPSGNHVPPHTPLPCVAGMMPTTSPFSPDGMMPVPAFPGPIAALMGPVPPQTQSANPFAVAAAYHAYTQTNLSNLQPITPVSYALHTHDPLTQHQQQQQPPTSVTIPALSLPSTAHSPFTPPPAQTDPSSNSNSPFNDLALHSRLQSVVESLTPGRSTSTASPAGSTATYLPPISESIPSTTHFSSTHTLTTNATHTSHSHATCSHTSSHTSATTCTSIAPASIPTSMAAHIADRNREDAGNGTLTMYSSGHAVGVNVTADTMAYPVSSAHVGVLPGVLHESFHGNGNGLPAVSPPGVFMGVQAHQLAASPQRAHSVSVIGVRAGMNGSEVVVADASDMFMTKESSRGNGAESLLTATAATVVDDFWGVKWEEVLGANVKEWFTGKTRLGRGSYGEVYKASYYHSDVAVKVLPIRSATVHTVKQEIDVLRSTRHPNVVRFLGACLEPVTPGQSKPTRHLAIVMELCDIGTLHATITKARHLATRKRDARVMHFYSSWPTRLDVARGIAAGTAFLHSRHVVHRDLTSYNVLLHYGLPWQAKVADFGLSRDASGPELNYSGDLHSPGWRAPELLVPNSKYTMKADVYSFGVILWELLTLRQPWEEEFDKAQQAGPRSNLPMFIKNEVVTGARLRFPEPDQVGGDLPEAAQVIHLAERCWHSNPDDRPTMEEVVKKLEKIITQVRRRR